MPIINFEKQLETSKKAFFSDPKISKTNKEYMQNYIAYQEAKATKPPSISIILRHTQRFFRLAPEDVKTLFDDKNEVNKIFSEIRKTKTRDDKPISAATYQTVIARTKAFVNWLNEGLPDSFKDLKRSSKEAKRKLTSNDMLTETEINTLISATTDIQTRAMLSVQLDGGFRPSEFYDLKIGDITKVKDFFRVRVDGKTGERTVLLYHAIPELASWLNIHPDKNNPNAWLWLTDYKTPGKYRRPTNTALYKRIRSAFEGINLQKKCDLYALRHNANVRKKRNGVQDSIASQQAGHSVKMFAETYGRLCDEDKEEALRKAYGIEDTSEDKSPIKCSCGYLNPSTADYCMKEDCGEPLTLEGKARSQLEEEKRIQKMVDKMVKEKVADYIGNKMNNI